MVIDGIQKNVYDETSAGKLNTKEIKPILIQYIDKCGHHTEGICSS